MIARVVAIFEALPIARLFAIFEALRIVTLARLVAPEGL